MSIVHEWDVRRSYIVADSCQRAEVGDDASTVMWGCSLTVLLLLVGRGTGGWWSGEERP